MSLVIPAVILFIIADIIIRIVIKKVQQNKIKAERAAILEDSLTIDFSKEAKTMKRAVVDEPKAKILCVDDEPVILDSFRKILVLDGYCVDTVENGSEALKLLQSNHYDFVFTDLRMPEMDGVEVTKAVKHIRPDIDVIIITGYAAVDTAVETMKYGAMDYVEKPFTEDELLAFVNKCVIKRNDRIMKQLKPKVNILHYSGIETIKSSEFAIPGGVFITDNHCWITIEQAGTIKIGIDDFATKLIGKIDDIDLPNLGMSITKGQTLFSIKQGNKSIPIKSPVSGKISKINLELVEDLEVLKITPYEKHWICAIDSENLDSEIPNYKIGKTAVNFYEEDIKRYQDLMKKINIDKDGITDETIDDSMSLGELEHLDDYNWDKVVRSFFIN